MEYRAGNPEGPKSDISDYLPVYALQQVQDSFFRVTTAPAGIFGKNDQPITRPSGTAEFCDIIRSSTLGMQRCRNCHELLNAQASMHGITGMPCAYIPAIVNAAVPIIADGKVLGVFATGPVLTDMIDESNLARYTSKSGMEAGLLIKAIETLPRLPMEDFLSHLRHLDVVLQLLIAVSGSRTDTIVSTDLPDLQTEIDSIRTAISVATKIRGVLHNADNLDELTHAILQVLQDDRGYSNAWIVLFDAEQNIVASSEAGIGEIFKYFVTQYENDLVPDCIAAVLSAGEVQVRDAPVAACRDCPLIRMCNNKTGLTVRLKDDSGMHGVLSVYMPHGLFDESGEKPFITSISRDIAFAVSYHLGKMENRQMKSDIHVRNEAIESSINPIAITDLSGNIQYANPAFLKIWGFQKQSTVSGRSIFSFFHRDNVPVSMRMKFLRDMLSKGYIRQILPGLSLDGRPFYLALSASLIKDMNKEPFGFAVHMIDVTELKQKEELLRKSEVRFTHITENAEEWIWEIDSDNRFLYVNPVAEKILGFTPQELMNDISLRDLVHPSSVADFASITKKLHSGYKSLRDVELTLISKQGTPVLTRSKCFPFFGELGEHLGYRGVTIDITELVRLREEIESALAQIAENIKYFQILNDEIRNPLTIMVASLELSDFEFREKLLAQIDAINRLITQLDQGTLQSMKIVEYLKKHHSL